MYPASTKCFRLDVQRNGPDRRYLDASEPLCPLTLDLFAAEIATRERERRE